MSNRVKILDGMVTLGQRANMKTQTWTAEYKLPGQKGRIVKTTGTQDLEEAQAIATDEFYDMVAALRRGYAPKPKLFGKIARDYLEVMQEEAEHGLRSQGTVDDFKPVLDRYLIPYFGNKPIDAITDKDIRDYAK